MHAAALAEDAAAFDYDSHFDAMVAARAAPAAAEKLARAPRYVAALMATAEERRREQEVLMERRLAKERAVEDHLYGDKEKFVTSAYRAKMAEEAAWKAGRAAAEAEEAANAVEKRGHMSNFYRGVLRGNGVQGPVAAAAAAPAAADKAAERPAAVEPPPAVERPAAAAERCEGGAAPPAERAAAPAGGERPAEDGAAPAPAVAAAPAAPPEAAAPPEPPRARDDAVASARERYLARKRKAAGGEG
jgi:coiled-coil domain-containing protein 55